MLGKANWQNYEFVIGKMFFLTNKKYKVEREKMGIKNEALLETRIIAKLSIKYFNVFIFFIKYLPVILNVISLVKPSPGDVLMVFWRLSDVFGVS